MSQTSEAEELLDRISELAERLVTFSDSQGYESFEYFSAIELSLLYSMRILSEEFSRTFEDELTDLTTRMREMHKRLGDFSLPKANEIPH